MNKSRLGRITVLFFVVMLCFTILSRAADQAGTAVVRVAKPENKMITHEVRAAGKAVQNQELAVTTEADQRVTAIEVDIGQNVQKGDLLFTLDTDLLKEKILNQKQEMQKQKLQVKDAKSQKEVSAQQKANEQAAASEQYSLSTGRAGTQLARAKRELQEAKKALSDYRKKSGVTQEETSVGDSLERLLSEKTNDYLQAEQELATLQWEIENAVNKAKENAKSGASLLKNGAVRTQAEEEPLIIEEEGSADAGTASGDMQEAGQTLIIDTLEMCSPDSSSPAADMGLLQEDEIPAADMDQPQEDEIPAVDMDQPQEDEIPAVDMDQPQEDEIPAVDMDQPQEDEIPAVDMDQPQEDEIPAVDMDQPQGSEIPVTEDDAVILDELDVVVGSTDGSADDGGNGVMDGSADNGGLTPGDHSGAADSGAELTQAELDRIGQSVRDSYKQELQAAQKKVETALAEKTDAEQALAEYQQERLTALDAKSAEAEQQLIAKVQAAQDAYEDAALAANEAAVTSGRAIHTAGIPNASNSSDEMNEITYEQMELQLKKLEKLQESGGRVYAPADGLVTKINIQTGEKTSDTTAVLMADLSKGYRFTAEITKEQEKYIGAGDEVTLTDSRKKKYEGLPVESVTADEENGEAYRVVVQLPEDSLELGAAATLEYSRKSEAYPVCVPLTAMHLDEKNQPYVLVYDEYDSVMGTELRARKVSVTVQEQNEAYAALAEGTISSQDQIIVSSSKAVDDGSRIRIQS